MTNEELEREVKRLEEQITELRFKILESKGGLIPYKPYEVEVPDDIGNYYFVNESGAITLLKDVFFSVGYEKVYLRGLAFKTREEAEQFDEERILITKLKDWAKKYNGGWTPNWKDCNETKYFSIFDKLYETFKIDCYARIKPFSKLPYFKSEEISEQFIKEFGEEIKEVLC